MDIFQRTGRVLLLTATLVISSILFAMIGALGLFLMERARELRNTPFFYQGLMTLLIGMAVNIACVLILLQVKKADQRLMSEAERRLTESLDVHATKNE